MSTAIVEAPEVAEPAAQPAPVPFVPGIDYSMPHADYLRIPALGSTDLGRLLRSAAHYRAGVDADDPATDAQDIGTALHLAIFEPQRFAVEVIVRPAFDRRTKSGRAEAEAWSLEHADMLALDAEACDAVCRMADAVRAHPAAREQLAAGAPEVTLQWVDPDTGVPCKARIDWLTPSGGAVDLKSTRDASPAAFARSIAQFGYAVQAAHYDAGAVAVLGGRFAFWRFIAVEKSPPYAVAVYELDADAMLSGAARRADALARFLDCSIADRWPAYSDSILSISLPRWAL